MLHAVFARLACAVEEKQCHTGLGAKLATGAGARARLACAHVARQPVDEQFRETSAQPAVLDLEASRPLDFARLVSLDVRLKRGGRCKPPETPGHRMVVELRGLDNESCSGGAGAWHTGHDSVVVGDSWMHVSCTTWGSKAAQCTAWSCSNSSNGSRHTPHTSAPCEAAALDDADEVADLCVGLPGAAPWGLGGASAPPRLPAELLGLTRREPLLAALKVLEVPPVGSGKGSAQRGDACNEAGDRRVFRV